MASGRDLASVGRDAMLSSPEFADLAAAAAARIRAVAERGENEATIALAFDSEVRTLAMPLGVDYLPRKEQSISTVRRVAPGRTDTRIGNLVVEFKQPTEMVRGRKRESATEQLRGYVETLAADPGGDVVGFLTDGTEVQRVASEAGVVVIGAFQPLTGAILTEYLSWFLRLRQTALTSENLASRLHAGNGPLIVLVRELWTVLQDRPADRSRMLHEEWRRLFKLSHSDTSQQRVIEERRSALETVVGERFEHDVRAQEYLALFSLQTGIAVVVKLIADKVVTALRGGYSATDFRSRADLGDDELRRFLEDLERGANLRDEGFSNLLEGDFFSWYPHREQWTPRIAAAVRDVIRVLAEFEHSVFGANGPRVDDLFKELYEAAIPVPVRRSLGEYYTPGWLADHTVGLAIEEVGPRENWRGLDPCCGSGTFLSAMMGRLFDAGVTDPQQIRSRVVGIDLNPLAVLMARVNYFVNLSPHIGAEDAFEIPVYLGDSSKLPSRVTVGGVECVRYDVDTKLGVLEVVLPRSVMADPVAFSTTMTFVEEATVADNADLIHARILSICAAEDLVPEVDAHIRRFADTLVDFERQNWDGIWSRIVANFFATAELGRFDIIVGNPPWIDWKNLPENYRDSLISKVGATLFSGDAVTGGVNLNICAVITVMSATNWLADGGALAFLMPETLLYQQTYEGFRRLPAPTGSPWTFRRFIDWTRAGHPFHPVTQPFFGYVVSRRGTAPTEVPVDVMTLAVPNARAVHRRLGRLRTFDEARSAFVMSSNVAVQPDPVKNYFLIAADPAEAALFERLGGSTLYRGREGIEFYPQDLLLFEHVPGHARTVRGKATERFVNYQGLRSKHRLPRRERNLETIYLRPLLKGVDIRPFQVDASGFYVPFTYDRGHLAGRAPIPRARLVEDSPALARYFADHRDVFEAQTAYNSRIIGAAHDTEFYALARVGEYSHADVAVAYRDNTSWGAAVVTPVALPWGGTAMPVFQNHAVSITEGPNGPIGLDEAHYVAAFLNAPLVGSFVRSSSDARTYPIRLRVAMPAYDADDADHVELRDLSRRAHRDPNDAVTRAEIDVRLDELVSAIISRR